MFEDPLAGDHICTGRPRKKIPSVVGEKSRKLGLHGSTMMHMDLLSSGYSF
jgi:hypothetical protein